MEHIKTSSCIGKRNSFKDDIGYIVITPPRITGTTKGFGVQIRELSKARFLFVVMPALICVLPITL